VEAGWQHTIALHRAQVGQKRALDAAERDLHANPSDEDLARIVELARQNEAVGPGEE
jgi:hypothetical protein